MSTGRPRIRPRKPGIGRPPPSTWPLSPPLVERIYGYYGWPLRFSACMRGSTCAADVLHRVLVWLRPVDGGYRLLDRTIREPCIVYAVPALIAELAAHAERLPFAPRGRQHDAIARWIDRIVMNCIEETTP